MSEYTPISLPYWAQLVHREQAMAEYVRMSDGWDQAALLAELEALLTADEWCPPNMTPELARHVGDLLRSGVRVAKLRLVPPSHSPGDGSP
jgi:hypothetical protein